MRHVEIFSSTDKSECNPRNQFYYGGIYCYTLAETPWDVRVLVQEDIKGEEAGWRDRA